MSEWIKRLAAKYAEVNESKFLIPEEIPTAERTAFMGAAAAAHKAGQTHFNFGGKKHKVTMKTDTARAIADDVKEAADLDAKSAEKAIRHDCATHVEHAEFGKGECIPGMHTIVETSEGEGYVTHYDVLFSHGLEENVSVDDLTILAEMSHGHKKMKKEGEEEVVMNPKNKKDKNASQETMAAEAKINELKKSTLGSYIKKAGPDAVKQTAKATRHDAAGIDADKDADMYSHFAKSQRAMDKASNRSKYIGKAVDKLTGKARVSAKESYESVEQIDELKTSTMTSWAKKVGPKIDRERNKVKAALDQPASVKHADAGLKAMSRLKAYSKSSDNYVNKITGRSKVKPTAESFVAEGSYERAAYGKGDAYDRSEAHVEAARDHEMAAEKHEKARNFETADLHTAASKAHQKAADYFSRLHSKRGKGGGTGIASTVSSRAAHDASQKANSFKESAVPPVYARILESREAHYKKASKPEDWDEKEKNNKGAMDMKADHKGETIDNPEAGDQMAKATNAAPSAKARSGDNKAGDKKIIPSATPTKGM